MAVNFATTFAQINLFDTGSQQKASIEPIQYTDLTGFMILNYTVLVCIISIITILIMGV